MSEVWATGTELARTSPDDPHRGRPLRRRALHGGSVGSLIAWSASHSVTDETGYTYTTSAPPAWIFLPLGLFGLWWLATIVPNLALAWRRMHDINLPGPLWLISIIASPAAIVFACIAPSPAGARYDRPDGR